MSDALAYAMDNLAEKTVLALTEVSNSLDAVAHGLHEIALRMPEAQAPIGLWAVVVLDYADESHPSRVMVFGQVIGFDPSTLRYWIDKPNGEVWQGILPGEDKDERASTSLMFFTSGAAAYELLHTVRADLKEWREAKA